MGRFKTVLFISLVVSTIIIGACRPTSTATPAEITPILPTPPPSPQAELSAEWTKIEPGGDTRCAHDTPYAYWVRPGVTNNVFVYFQGGGGCYDAESCATLGSYNDDVTDRDNPDYTIGGVFNLNHSENPFRDYTMVYVPYCTGDVHAGNRVENYTTKAGKAFNIYHRGYVNATTAINWVYETVKQPDSIFVTGCSAGSVGSILHTPHIIEHYPETPVIQLGDSAGGLTSYIAWDIDGDYDAGDYFPSWIPDMQDEIAQSFTLSKFYSAVANHYPTYQFSQFNAINDSTQRRYFVADGGLADDFPTALQTSLNEIESAHDNFYSYTAPGERHCILKHTEFYHQETDGVRLRDWVSNLANQMEVETVTCTTC